MPPQLPQELFRQGLVTLMTVGGPLFATLLIIGLVVGVFQAATQVNDPSIGFLSRLVAALAICWFSGGWIIERLAAYLTQALRMLAEH